ncbi:MAG TPA: Lsr2 family protein [Nocardioidaceae bacterium]|nr:Lsr2 family protein [Nocardioidaceae bacterium]
MAREVQIKLVDDLDGGAAAETVSFGLDGTSYEIDLSKRNASKLRSALDAYIAGGRKVTPARRGRSRGRAAARAGGPAAAEVRDWARDNGWEVSDRGRVPAEVREAYDAAH